MGLLARIWNGPPVTAEDIALARSDFPAYSPPAVQVSYGPFYGFGSSGSLSSRDLLSVPAVGAALDLIASVGASFPVTVVNSRGRVLRDQELPRVVAKPDPMQTRYQAVHGWLFNLGLFGRLWWQKVRVGQEVMALIMVDPTEIAVRRVGPGSHRVELWYNGQKVAPSDYEQVWLWKVAGEAQGCGPLQTNTTVLQAIIGANQRALSSFTDDATPPMVLETDQRLSPESAAESLEQFERKHRGRDRVALLTGGVKAKTIQHDNRLQQWDESRHFGVLEVGRMFHLPEKLLLAASGGSTVTYQNVAQVAIDLLRFAVQPYLDRIEDQWSAQLPTGWQVRFDTSTFNRADIAARFNAYSTALGGQPFLTPEEVRELEGMDRAGAPIGLTQGTAE